MVAYPMIGISFRGLIDEMCDGQSCACFFLGKNGHETYNCRATRARIRLGKPSVCAPLPNFFLILPPASCSIIPPPWGIDIASVARAHLSKMVTVEEISSINFCCALTRHRIDIRMTTRGTCNISSCRPPKLLQMDPYIPTPVRCILEQRCAD
ncbi:hypothetical protein EI94DRAFT_839297 [Lactarius quietus]|nr:hypothetical protein EI94DRAFT_839297 [Lactarius quietus]